MKRPSAWRGRNSHRVSREPFLDDPLEPHQMVQLCIASAFIIALCLAGLIAVVFGVMTRW